jgi:hypothetical protein
VTWGLGNGSSSNRTSEQCRRASRYVSASCPTWGWSKTPKRVVGMDRNRWSDSTETGGRIAPKRAPTASAKTATTHDRPSCLLRQSIRAIRTTRAATAVAANRERAAPALAGPTAINEISAVCERPWPPRAPKSRALAILSAQTVSLIRSAESWTEARRIRPGRTIGSGIAMTLHPLARTDSGGPSSACPAIGLLFRLFPSQTNHNPKGPTI